jgi:hypothetical protein
MGFPSPIMVPPQRNPKPRCAPRSPGLVHTLTCANVVIREKRQNASQNISCPSNCSRIDDAVGDLRQRRPSPRWLPWPLSFAWCLGILLAWWLVALRQLAGLWLLAMDPRLDLLDLRLAPLNAARQPNQHEMKSRPQKFNR